ncbi:MAG: NAD(P)-dependent oxidoreductase [Sphingomonadaceae bacterium]|nr:NAD(P)-dependent oxidoreductase [Sphingomonadaceae bacterium]
MQRTILVIGGTGLIGGAAALHLRSLGHAVTINGRTPTAAPALAGLDFLAGDYTRDDIGRSTLRGFDTVVFCAGQDGRRMPVGSDPAAHFHRTNIVAVPAFLAKARDAGVERCVYVGSYYPCLLSQERVDADPYLIGRQITDMEVRKLDRPGFTVCSLAAPFVMGWLEGVKVELIELIIRYLVGEIGGPGPRFIFPGGSNYMSTLSFSEAIAGAIERGEPGKEYLMGDENLSYFAFYDAVRRALGLPDPVEVRDADHPVIPNGSYMTLRGGIPAYEPDPEMVARLGYRRHDFLREVADMIPKYARELGIVIPA